jgi:hypothetical protein
MSLHGWITAALAAGVLGLGALVAAQPSAGGPEPGEDDALVKRLDRMETELAGALRKLNERPRIARSAQPPAIAVVDVTDPARHAAPPGSTDAPAEDAPLEARVAELEKQVALIATQSGVETADPKTLSNEELMKRAGQMTAANRRGARGVAGYQTEESFWREALTRDLTEDERHSALYGLGIALRGQKRHAAEAAVFEEMVERAGGLETEKGVSAGFQLGWARAYSSDWSEAVRTFDGVANSRSVTPLLRVHALLRAGEYAMRADDSQRAREYFQRLVSDHRDDVPQSQAWLLSNAEQHIRKIDEN